jgi:hypothetical protein
MNTHWRCIILTVRYDMGSNCSRTASVHALEMHFVIDGYLVPVSIYSIIFQSPTRHFKFVNMNYKYISAYIL